MLGTKCRACRRYVLSWPHIFVLVVIGVAAVVVLLKYLN